MPPALIANLLVTVDTEEDDAWSGFRATGNTVRNAEGLGRFQQLCDRHEVFPTYLVDEPVVDSDLAVARLSGFAGDGRCEIGAHLHPWCGEPFEEEINARNSYLCNLSERLQHAKLSHLTNRIEEQFGQRPTSFRAGRYGLDHIGAGVLANLGYVVDSSVIPFTNYERQGGPNFETASYRPYFPSPQNLCQASADGQLLEIPVGVGFSRSNFASAQRWRNVAMLPGLRHMKMVGIFDRVGIARRIKLSPEQSDASQMKRLIDMLLAQGAPCAVLMLHSSSLTVGTSPYVRSDGDLERLYDRLGEVFQYCRKAQEMKAPTLTQFATAFCKHGVDRPAAPQVATDLN